jgi:hypothetical protein
MSTEPNEREALLPCPFCGSAAEVQRHLGEDMWSHNVVTWTTVSCTECECQTRATCPGWEPEAVDAWQARAALSTPPAAVAQAADVGAAQPWTEALHKFLDAAAGEGLVLDSVDAADLYVAIFPERYAATSHPTPKE